MREFESVQLQINRQSGRTQKLCLKGSTQEESSRIWIFSSEDEDAAVQVSIEQKGGCLTGRVKVRLKAEPFRENDGLALNAPVRLILTFSGQIQRAAALYLHRDWWTRPAFIRDFASVPARTQCMYLDWGDDRSASCRAAAQDGTVSAAHDGQNGAANAAHDGQDRAAAVAKDWQNGAANAARGRYGCLWLMAGKRYKAMACGGEKADALTIELTAYQPGILSLEETVFVLSEENEPYAAIASAAETVAAEAGILLKNKKRLPEMFEYLGWCSWDAFYTDIDEEKVRKKAAELKEKRVPARWLLLDDGWLSVRENRLYDFAPEKSKFPEGFQKLTEELKADGQFMNIGVWHALGGYWGGVEPGSAAALLESQHLYETKTGKLLPAPRAENGYGFYRDWYEYLRGEGIDFVKVDGQSAVKNYYANDIPVCQAARETHRALEGAAAAYMNANLINCMGMAMENLMGRQGSALCRNSDDFVPDNPEGFAEHLLQNAYNAPYHDLFYYCDWDMYWTFHPDAQKHAVLRAVSGGPVYFSDRIGDTDREAVMPLVYRDGRILRMDRSAKPSADCLFTDPCTEGAVKLTNIADCGIAGQKGGAAAVYNLTGKPAQTQVRTEDIYDLPEGNYFCYDRMKMKPVDLEESFMLAPEDFGLYLFVPLRNGTAVLGLIQKYISFHALEEVKQLENGFLAVVREAGEFAFYTEKKVERVFVNGEDRTEQTIKEDGVWRVTGTGNGMMLVQAVLK